MRCRTSFSFILSLLLAASGAAAASAQSPDALLRSRPASASLGGGTRACAATLSAPWQLRVRIVPDTVTTQVQAQNLTLEAERIWRRNGVQLHWVATPEEPTDIWVYVVDVPPPVKVSEMVMPIAWIAFYDGTPQRIIRISRLSMNRLVDARLWQGKSERISSLTQDLQEEAVGRAWGRALAHEIGHYLLSSKAHTKTGLMRASLPDHDLIAESAGKFTLEAEQVQQLNAVRLQECATWVAAAEQ